MVLTVKRFDELTLQELYQVLKLRESVFVVEQNCPYQEIDGNDVDAVHLWLSDEDGIVAYARVLKPGTMFETAAIGRVISVKRRRGYATEILKQGIRIARECFSAEKITVEAQVYARKLYEGVGFVQTSDEFLEDGIPHILMVYNTTESKEIE